VAVSSNHAYVADGGSGLRIIDISNPANPTEVGYYDTPRYSYGVAVSNNFIYVADYDDGLQIYQGYGPAGITDTGIQNAEGRIQNLRVKVYGNTIEYSMPQSGTASLKVYNLLGQEVNSLVRENKTAGNYKINWDGRDGSGRRVSSGVYLVRLEANGQATTGKMLVVR